MNQQREKNSFERFSIIRETWHLDPLRRRLLRSHFFDALSSLISVKVESKFAEAKPRVELEPRGTSNLSKNFRFFSCLSSMLCDIISTIIISLNNSLTFFSNLLLQIVGIFFLYKFYWIFWYIFWIFFYNI